MGGACANKSFDCSVSRCTSRTERRSKRNESAELEPTPSLTLFQSSPEVLSTIAQALNIDLAVLAEHDPVARLPGGRLGDVGQLELVGPVAAEVNLHVDEAGAGAARTAWKIDRARARPVLASVTVSDFRKSSILSAGTESRRTSSFDLAPCARSTRPRCDRRRPDRGSYRRERT